VACVQESGHAIWSCTQGLDAAYSRGMRPRLEWNESCRAFRSLLDGPRPTHGRISRPIATAADGTMAWGWDAAAEPVWVRRWHGGRPAKLRLRYREAAAALSSLGVEVPDVVGMPDVRTVLLDRRPWSASSPAGGIISSYVENALEDVIKTGRLVVTGRPHVTASGTLVIEDIVDVVRLEHVDRCVVFEVSSALVRRDRRALASAIDWARGSYDDRCDLAVRRCTAGLLLEWTATSFALALHEIARALTAGSAGRTHLFEAVADELTHRLDLTHQHRVPVQSADVARILERCSP